MGDQNKGFEKPGGVGEMPFGRARIGHALEAEVFGFKRLNQSFAGAAYVHEPAEQRAGSWQVDAQDSVLSEARLQVLSHNSP